MNNARRVMRKVVRPTSLFEGVDPKRTVKLVKELRKYFKEHRGRDPQAVEERVTWCLIGYAVFDPTIPNVRATKVMDIFNDGPDAAPDVFRRIGEGGYLKWIVGQALEYLKRWNQFVWLDSVPLKERDDNWKEQFDKVLEFLGSYKRTTSFRKSSSYSTRKMAEAETWEAFLFPLRNVNKSIKDAFEQHYLLTKSPMGPRVPPISSFNTILELGEWVSSVGNASIILADELVPKLYLDDDAVAELAALGGGPDDEAIYPHGELLADGAFRADLLEPSAFEEIRQIAEQPRYIAVRVTGYESADDKHHGGGTHWCTRHGVNSEYIDNYFRDENTPLYVVYCSKEVDRDFPLSVTDENVENLPVLRCAQFHFEGGDIGDFSSLSVNNISNSPISTQVLEQTLMSAFLHAVCQMEKGYEWTPPAIGGDVPEEWAVFDRKWSCFALDGIEDSDREEEGKFIRILRRSFENVADDPIIAALNAEALTTYMHGVSVIDSGRTYRIEVNKDTVEHIPAITDMLIGDIHPDFEREYREQVDMAKTRGMEEYLAELAETIFDQLAAEYGYWYVELENEREKDPDVEALASEALPGLASKSRAEKSRILRGIREALAPMYDEDDFTIESIEHDGSVTLRANVLVMAKLMDWEALLSEIAVVE